MTVQALHSRTNHDLHHSGGQCGALTWRHQQSAGAARAAWVYFPIELADSSGVAHVLEHATAVTPVGDAQCTWATLPYSHPDLALNARTEADHIAFHFTCATAQAFDTALSTLLRAALLHEPGEHEFRQESFTFTPTPSAGGRPRIGGTVHNEMRGRFGEVSRQLGSATLEALHPRKGWHFDPGGDPDLIMRLTHDSLLDFRRRMFQPERCTVLACTPDGAPALVAALQGIVGERSPAAAEVRPMPVPFRGGRFTGHWPAEGDEQRNFHRIALEIGSPACAQDVVSGWFLDMAAARFEPAFRAFADKLGLRHEASLSGSLDLGMRLVFAVTFSGVTGERQILAPFAPLLAHLLRALPALQPEARFTEQQLDLRERLHCVDGEMPSRLQHWMRGILNGQEAEFHSLGDDVDRVAQRGEQDPAWAADLAERLGRAAPVEAIVRAHPINRPARINWEGRRNEKLARRGFVRAAPPVPRPAPEAAPVLRAPVWSTDDEAHAIATGGVTYVHRVFNVSCLGEAQVPLVPLALAYIEARLAAVGRRVSGFMFAHVTEQGDSLLAVSFKTRHRSGHDDPGADLTRLLETAVDNPGDACSESLVARLHAELSGSPAHLVLSQCTVHETAASRAIRQWRGAEQLAFLRSKAHPGQAGLLEQEIRRVAATLLAAPASSIVVGSGLSRRQVLAQCDRDIQSQRWPVVGMPHGRARGDACLAVPRHMRSLLQGSHGESVLAQRLALPWAELEQMAAWLVLGSALERHTLRPVLRDHLGAYGATVGLDLATAEVYLLVQQPSSVQATMEALDQLDPLDALSCVKAADFERLRCRALFRLQGQESPANAAIRDGYNRLTGAWNRLRAVAETIRRIGRDQAVAAVGSSWAAAARGSVLYLPEGHDTSDLPDRWNRIE